MISLTPEDRNALRALRALAERDPVGQPVAMIDKAALRWLLDLLEDATTAPANRLVQRFYTRKARWEGEHAAPMPDDDQGALMQQVINEAERDDGS